MLRGVTDALNDFFNQDTSRQQDYRDFVGRYDNDPEEISDVEAARRYREIMAKVDNDDQDMSNAYNDLFGKLNADERRQLAERFREANANDGRPYHGYDTNVDSFSPRELGRMTRRAANQDPDLLEEIFGRNSPIASGKGKMILASLAVMAARKFLGRR
jgi:hypothetical protein